MPDAPDGARYIKQSNYIPLLELGELAVRLGSTYTFHRSGLVVFSDDFSNGFDNWEVYNDGNESYNQLSKKRSLVGPFSLWASNDAGTDVVFIITKYGSIRDANKMGLTVGFMADDSLDYLYIKLTVIENNVGYQAGLRFNYTALTIEYLNSSGTWSEIADLSPYQLNLTQYHYFKLIADFDTHKYLLALFDGLAIDVTEDIFQEVHANNDTQVGALIAAENVSGEGMNLYIDCVTLTTDEPFE